MSTSRRGTGRKSQNVPRESTTQGISKFVHRRSKDELVEIDDEDEVQVLTDQFAFTEEDVQPFTVKRRKKNLIFEDSDDDLDEMEGMDEDEKRQMKEAIRQSRLQLEVESKRRTTHTTSDMELISEDEPAKSGKIEDNNADLEDETQDYLSVPSSPGSSGMGKQQEERAESPELFGTPRSSNEKEEADIIPDKACSPSKTPFKTFFTNDLKATFNKDVVINLTPVKSKNKLKLKKKESLKEQEKEVEDTSEFKSNDQNKEDLMLESRKRKHILYDEDDDTEDTGQDFVAKDPKKKQKTIEQVFNVKHMKKDEKQKGRILDPTVVVNDDDEDDEGEGSMEDDGTVLKRNDPAAKFKKSSTTRLERVYSKPRLSIKTIKDAMKARLYFAPPGIDPKAYTYAIMRMMDHTRKRIYRAQRKSLNFIKWGKPIVTGPRETNSLDTRKEKKKSNMGGASTSAFTPLDTFIGSEAPSLERRSSLRSAQKSTTSSPIKTEPVTAPAREDSRRAQRSTAVSPIKKEPAKVSAREGTSRVERDDTDSDDSDDDLTKSVFGETTSKPMKWNDYHSTKESEAFGENVITSTGHKNKSVDTGSFKRDPFTINAASSSFAGVEDATKHVTETERNKGEYMNGNREKLHVKLENAAETNDRSSPRKYRENNDAPVKQMEKKRTMVSELIDNEEEEIDSSIEIGMNKPKKHVKKALIEDVEEEEEEEEDSHGPLAKFGIEVKDDDMDHDVHTTTEPAEDARPGASLTNVATKSGYLRVDRTPDKILGVQRVMSSAARRAAEAAEKRMRGSSLQSSPDISSSMELPSQELIPSSEDNCIECPICFSKFYKDDIETHAATCYERAPTFNPSSLSPRKSTTNREAHKSIGAPVESQEQKNKDLGLKNLQVMLTRSPEAHRRLQEQKSYSASKARRNLSLNRATRSVTNNQGSAENRRSRRYIDMTMDDVNNPEVKKEDSVDEKETPEEDSPSVNWFSNTASQMDRKKNKFKLTYGGKKKKQDSRHNPFATLDHMYHGEYPSSDDAGHGDAAAPDDDDDDDDDEEMNDTDDNKSEMIKTKEKKSDTKDATMKGASSLSMEKDTISSDKYGDIESDSDASDIEMLATYGVKVASKKRKLKDKKSINDILQPQKQENPKKKKKRMIDDFDNDDYDNEMALLELSGVALNRSKFENKSSERSTKRRWRRISSSEESEDNNDDFERCYICFDKVPKEEYKDHTDTCLEKKGERFATPGKGLCQDRNSRISSRSRSTAKQSTSSSSQQTVEMDSDEIGDSPIKTFKLIGEESGSGIDFGNQFAFFNKAKGGETRRRSKSGGRNKSGKYRGKGRYKRGRGKRKF